MKEVKTKFATPVGKYLELDCISNPTKKLNKNKDKKNFTYYNCRIKGYFANNYAESLKQITSSSLNTNK